MTGALTVAFAWLLAASTLLLWLVPVVFVIDRLTARHWSAEVRAWLWRLLLLRILVPTAVIPGTMPLTVPALPPTGERGASLAVWVWLTGAVLFACSGALAAWRQALAPR